jgi:hypothetical protein
MIFFLKIEIEIEIKIKTIFLMSRQQKGTSYLILIHSRDHRREHEGQTSGPLQF